jgi:hypothetical protein
LVDTKLDASYREWIYFVLKTEERSIDFELMLRSTRSSRLEIGDAKNVVPERNGIAGAESVGGEIENDFRRHLPGDALVDVEAERCGLVVLNESLFDRNCCVTMLLNSL